MSDLSKVTQILFLMKQTVLGGNLGGETGIKNPAKPSGRKHARSELLLLFSDFYTPPTHILVFSTLGLPTDPCVWTD